MCRWKMTCHSYLESSIAIIENDNERVPDAEVINQLMRISLILLTSQARSSADESYLANYPG